MFKKRIVTIIKDFIFFLQYYKMIILIILSFILLLCSILFIIKQSSTQNCLAQISVNLPVEGTLLNALSVLGNKDSETFDRESKNIIRSFFNLSGSYRLLIKADKPSATIFNGIIDMKKLYQVGCFRRGSAGINESLKYPLFEAFDADIEFFESEKMLSYGLGFGSQLEVFQGKCNFLTVVNDGIFEINNAAFISQKGYIQTTATIISLNKRPLKIDIDFPIDFIGRLEPVICALTPDFRISGYNEDGMKISSQIYESAFMNPLNFNFIAFFPEYDTKAFINTREENNLVLITMDVSNSSINISSDTGCILSVQRCEGVLNIMDTLFPLKNRSDLSNIVFHFESIDNIDVRYKFIDEKNISMGISIDGKTNKVILDGKKIGVYSAANIYKMITSDFIITTLFSSSVAGFFAAFFMFIFEKKKR